MNQLVENKIRVVSAALALLFVTSVAFAGDESATAEIRKIRQYKNKPDVYLEGSTCPANGGPFTLFEKAGTATGNANVQQRYDGIVRVILAAHLSGKEVMFKYDNTGTYCKIYMVEIE